MGLKTAVFSVYISRNINQFRTNFNLGMNSDLSVKKLFNSATKFVSLRRLFIFRFTLDYLRLILFCNEKEKSIESFVR